MPTFSRSLAAVLVAAFVAVPLLSGPPASMAAAATSSGGSPGVAAPAPRPVAVPAPQPVTRPVRSAPPRRAAMATDVPVTALHSRPGAPVTIHLDLDGAVVTGTAFNTWAGADPLVASGFDRDGDPATLGDREQDQVRRAWRYVADKFAPFDVDVTTEAPTEDALRQLNPQDPTWGLTVLFTDHNELWTACGRCGGAAYLQATGAGEGWQEIRDSYGLSWVFVPEAANGEDLGGIATNDLGHTAGVQDRGQVTDTVSSPVYAGTELWAPLMGVPYRAATATWSDGAYPGATPAGQDDLAVLDAAYGRADDDRPDTAAALPEDPMLLAPGTTTGMIEDGGDVDVLGAEISGPTTITVAPTSPTSMLDVDVTVRDATTGVVLGRAAPPTVMAGAWAAVGMGASVEVAPPAGTTVETGRAVVVEVRGDGNSSPRPADRTTPYSALGEYRVTLTPSADAELLRVSRIGTLAATAGSSVSTEVVGTSGGVAPIRIGAILTPPGTVFDPSSGYLIGTAPTTPGRYPLRLVVADGVGTTRVLDSQLTVTAGPVAGPPVVTAPAPAQLEVGVPARIQLAATDGTGAIAWSSGTLPGGLTLSAGGLLTGTPTTPGETTVSVLATDDAGAQGAGELTLRVAPRLRAVTAAALPGGRSGAAYRARIDVDGGVGPLAWSLPGAASGVRLLPATGADSRTLALRLPTRTRRQGPGSVAVTVVVRDALGARVTRRYTIRVVPARGAPTLAG